MNMSDIVLILQNCYLFFQIKYSVRSNITSNLLLHHYTTPVIVIKEFCFQIKFFNLLYSQSFAIIQTLIKTKQCTSRNVMILYFFSETDTKCTFFNNAKQQSISSSIVPWSYTYILLNRLVNMQCTYIFSSTHFIKIIKLYY